MPARVRALVLERRWQELDRAIARETAPGGSIHARLADYADFSSIEHIISIRSSCEEPDEDGIWHDDGSRHLAFSLSLTLEPGAVEGGRLEIRERGASERAEIPTPEFGTMIVFATGQSGYEHRIRRVSAGERVIVAGWCT